MCRSDFEEAACRDLSVGGHPPFAPFKREGGPRCQLERSGREGAGPRKAGGSGGFVARLDRKTAIEPGRANSAVYRGGGSGAQAGPRRNCARGTDSAGGG